MTVRSVTISYSEKRSINYQSVVCQEAMTYDLDPDDDENAVYTEVRNEIMRRVRHNADCALRKLLSK